MKANFIDTSAMPSYSVMTVNMNGSGKPFERRDLSSKIIRASQPSLVFCQELPNCFEREVVRKCKGTCDYDFLFTDKETAVMWSKNDFCGELVDAAVKRRSFDTVVASQNFNSDVSEIPARTSVVKLTSKEDEACSVLAVSWHGPYSATRQKKQDVLKGLSLFLNEICRKTNVSSIIIGGDFNLNTLDENGLRESNVYFPSYKLSHRGERAKERKGPGRRYIAYKDNFAIITTSPSVVRPGDMKLSKVKPLSEGKDILDHDPIIGVLQLEKTPSTDLRARSRERDASVATEGPLTKTGKPDMRFKVNKEAYGQPSFQKSMKDSHSESERPLTKNGKPDMRFKVNKQAYGQSSFQKSYSSRSSSSGSISDGSSAWERDASVTTEGPLTKTGKPDMRFKVNKEAYGQPSFQKSTKDSHSESERPLTKNGKPDMRFKVNKQAYGQSSFQKSYSSRSPSSGSISDGSSAWERNASVTTEGPLTKNGKPDMRFKVNKEAYGQSSFQKSRKASHSESERYSVPRKKDGTPDMRYTVNKTPSTVNTALPLGNGATPLNGDGTPDMGFAVNKPARKPASPAQTSRSAVTSSSCEGPLKKDGTPDMRFASNKQSASSMSSLPSYSSACGPIRKTGAPDMTYATNKPYYDGPSSPGYWSGGSFYSAGLLASLASPGPLKSDGTADMRYATNRSSNASPYSYGGSTCSSGFVSFSESSFDGSSSCGPLKSDGTPDMRYAVNKSLYGSSSSYGGSTYSSGFASSSESSFDGSTSYGPLKSDGTSDMRYAVNKSLYGSSSLYGGSTYRSGSSSSEGSFDGFSSCGPLKKDGTPDMRFAVNKSLYGSSSLYGGSTYRSGSSSSESSSDGSSSWGPLKKDGTPDMRFKANRR